MLLSRELEHIDQLIPAIYGLNLPDPTELAQQDCFGLRSCSQVLTIVRKRFPLGKLGLRIIFSESQNPSIRQEDWRDLSTKFTWLYSFKIFFHNSDENRDECSDEAVIEIDRYFNSGSTFPQYVGIVHASVNLTLEIIQVGSHLSPGEVLLSRQFTLL